MKSPYYTWKGMIARCNHVGNHKYSRYGGRGISVCERWLSYENFLSDMGKRPDGMTLDRIDNDGDYCPENCRWATPSQQNRNRRDTRYIDYNGLRLPISEWADRIGIKRETLKRRLEHGWSVERALTERFHHENSHV